MHISCAACTFIRFAFAKMHRNFSLYSSLALAGSFFLFIFNASDSPSLSCVCMCVCMCRCHAEILKFAFAVSLTLFPLSIKLRSMGKKRVKSIHKKVEEEWWIKKSIKLHCYVVATRCGSFLKIWSWKALHFCNANVGSALFQLLIPLFH